MSIESTIGSRARVTTKQFSLNYGPIYGTKYSATWSRITLSPLFLSNPKMAKEHAESMETPSAVALLFVAFSRRLSSRVRRVVSTVNEFCAFMPVS
jgi:hypothetical protein